jgi:8-amino-7-oxononanoate synthase
MRSFESELAALEQVSLRRSLSVFQPLNGSTLTSPLGPPLLNFASNDYLGFASSPDLRDFLLEAVGSHGAGSGASRLVCGTSQPHADLENALADFKHAEAALAFSSGYATAVGTLTAIASRDDILILDKLCHASLIDGARLSGATLRIFPHNDTARLESLLLWARRSAKPNARIVVVTESIFSMDGDAAPLAEIIRLKDEHGALLLLDEAHGFGVFGPGGRGLAHALNLAHRVDLHMGTLSKAAGLHGGFVCGPRAFADLLVNRARSFIYSTAPPPAIAAAATRVITSLLPGPHGDSARARLHDNLALFSSLSSLPLPASPIVPIILGPESAALSAATALRAAGILAPAIRFPTVAKGKARLRLTFTASHSPDDIHHLVTSLRHLHTQPSQPADDATNP